MSLTRLLDIKWCFHNFQTSIFLTDGEYCCVIVSVTLYIFPFCFYG